MTAFGYEAARADGAVVRGRLEAPNRSDLAAALSRRGLFPLAIEQISSVAVPSWRRPSTDALAMLFRSLASLVGAGLPLVTALETTQRLTPGVLGEAVERIIARVRGGSTLGRAIEAENELIPAVTAGLLRAGEGGVGLATSLDAAAAELERHAETVSSLRAALAYPVVLMLVGGVSLAVILMLVVPRFADLLHDSPAELPVATRALLATSTLVRGHGLLVMFVASLVTGSTVLAVRRRRERWHDWLLALPIIGDIRHALATVRAARVLSTLLGAGGTALSSLRVARDAVGDQAVARRLERTAQRVERGASLSQALSSERALTPMVLRLAAVGDGTGELPRLLGRAADLEDNLTRRRVRYAVTLIEPLLIVSFATVVAFVALALLQAVYSLRPAAI
jgi:general secretion pathway protein F